jgi:dihydroorotate dehydrogenase (NAD+) catalytic subunit
MSIPTWFPEHPPIYDINMSYKDNADKGPFFDGDYPTRTMPPKNEWIDFLGHKVASPLGVPAGPLLNSKFTTLAARLGFDVVTYKTIRSQSKEAHPVPNMIYIDIDGPLKDEHQLLHQSKIQSADMDHLAVTNSFGMGCSSPDYLMADIEKANSELADGQVMIVSVVGTPREGEDFADDFVNAAMLAKEAGAKIIEANFSCPNVGKSKEGSIYTDPETIQHIATKIVQNIGDIPLVIKMGVYPSNDLMREALTAAAQSGAQAVCGINTVGRNVVKEDGSPALGPNRKKSGICGGPIRDYAIEYIRNARDIIDTDKLGLTLMGVGGVTKPEHFQQFLDEGAKIAMSATGMMWDPYLAMRYHQTTN